MRIFTVVGARPQFVKASAISRQIRSRPNLREILVHTGQHYDDKLSRVFFDELEIPAPDFNLGIGSLGHGAQTGRMLERIEKLLLETKPDCVLVYGDTNSTLAGALAASKLHIPVAHVEAGLRSFNRAMPEEINRVVTDHLSSLLFVPTENAKLNLEKEGISGKRVRLSGDVMYDVSKHSLARATPLPAILSLKSREYVLATIHRAENTDDLARLKTILEALGIVSRRLRVLLPIHPRTRKLLLENGLEGEAYGIELIEPVGYSEMASLERDAAVIATDSGGVQKEAYFARVPCVTFRNETEWTELVEFGWNQLVPPKDPEVLAQAILSSIGKQGRDISLYGDGTAATSIVDDLTTLL